MVRIRLDAYGDGSALVGLLDSGERSRADRFVRARDRRRYLVSHAVMRTVLGRCLGRPAAALRFDATPKGKPFIAGETLEFNLSHSGERALLAMTCGGAIGVDVEAVEATAAKAISGRFLSAAEHEALTALDDRLRVAAFFRCWARKESFIKAIGDGLGFPLREFDVAIDERAGNALVRCNVAAIRAGDWRVVSLAIDAGYAAAVTVTRGIDRVWQWDAPGL